MDGGLGAQPEARERGPGGHPKGRPGGAAKPNRTGDPDPGHPAPPAPTAGELLRVFGDQHTLFRIHPAVRDVTTNAAAGAAIDRRQGIPRTPDMTAAATRSAHLPSTQDFVTAQGFKFSGGRRHGLRHRAIIAPHTHTHRLTLMPESQRRGFLSASARVKGCGGANRLSHTLKAAVVSRPSTGGSICTGVALYAGRGRHTMVRSGLKLGGESRRVRTPDPDTDRGLRAEDRRNARPSPGRFFGRVLGALAPKIETPRDVDEAGWTAGIGAGAA